MLFGSALGTSGGSGHAGEVQRHLTMLGQAIADRTLELGVQREHGAKHFADRGEVVIGDPAAELEQLLVEHGRWVENGEDAFCGDGGLAVVQIDDDARHALLAKRDQHAAADDGRGVRGDTVGEDHVERHGHGDVAEFGHWLEG